MYGNRQNPPSYAAGYQPHPGAATYYYQDPPPYMYYSAPGAMGGVNYYVPEVENYSQMNDQTSQPTKKVTKDTYYKNSYNPGHKQDSWSSLNNHQSMHEQREPHGYRGGRSQPAFTSSRGSHRGNHRAQNYTRNSFGNNAKSEDRENHQYKARNNNGNNSQRRDEVVYGQGIYKNQYINKVRHSRAEREHTEYSNVQEDPGHKENFPNQKGINKNYKFSRWNKRENTKPNNRNNDRPSNYKVPHSSMSNNTPTNKFKNRNGKYTISKQTSGRDDEQERSIQLRNGIYECNVCMDKISQKDEIWSCQTCFNAFHLDCVKLWINNSIKDETWRCPACNTVQMEKTVKYRCYCKKVLNPLWNRKEAPHSCGQLCQKKRNPVWCVHACPDLCHPGACPPCGAFINRKCACGKFEKSLRCSDGQDLLCDNICDKPLNCGVHLCTNHCHTEDCSPCDNTIEKTCYCGKSNHVEVCTAESTSDSQYSCSETCGKLLNCGSHHCQKICHSGECMSCDREVSIVTHCPCGKKPLNKMEGPDRESCSDPIPTCGEICGKTLKCGNPGNFHTCAVPCHEGSCPTCTKVTPVKCRCGSMNADIPCVDLRVKADEVTCKKACKKLRHCGRHKCGVKCCIDGEHLCTRKCNQFLTCKTHRCEDICHRGKCRRCLRSSFDDLTCHCGYTILNPPIACGTEPPACDQPCVRTQRCEHLQTHKCHQGPCPPCTVLVPKPCCGDHKTMKNTPCYVSSLSCGSLCEKILSCGVHKCQKVCHEGDCQPEKKCVQICQKPRKLCGHHCGAKCHKSKCPETSCKVMIKIQCRCGTRTNTIQCSQNEKEFQAEVAAQLASKMHSTGESVDISALFSGSSHQDKNKRLECDDECKLKERNQRLALALQITNPEARDKLGDSSHLYSDQLGEDAKRDVRFTTMVHERLNDLVLRARESTQKNRSHSFAPMNRDKRRFIHEYSKHFGCDSKAYDEEPKKNVVVTATRGLCFLPPMSILTIVQREAGNRKVPGPYLSKIPRQATENSFKKLEKSNSQEKRDEELQASTKQFDYFDME